MLDKQTLNIIQSGSAEEVYYKTTQTALYIAAAGFLEQGNRLLSELWKYKLPHDRNVWLPDMAFTVLWHAAGVRPEYIPFEPADIDYIERYMRDYVASDRWAYPILQKPWQELSGQDLLRAAFITAQMERRQGQPKSFPSPSTELTALSMIEQLAAQNYLSDEGFALGAELAARHGETNRAVHLIKTWGKGSQSDSLRFRTPILAAGRHVAPLLLDGVLADQLNLSESIVSDFLTQAVTILNNRLSQGRSLAQGHLDWKTLIEEISKTAIQSTPELFEEDVIDSGWVGFSGASPQAISETEKRLGVSLPEDYKSFLYISNGIRSIGYTNSELLPVSQIDFIKNLIRPNLYEIICSYPEKEDDPEPYEAFLSRGIMISGEPGEQMVWLIAPRDESDTWQTWFFANWVPGDERFPGFRYFLESRLRLLTYKIENQH
ncbi:MAG: SMI1/KNR4 family protein [Bacteroidetes bacterium]|nr:SMI1/KNR4 family protein [Bacteroidota bacterium]